MAVRAGDNVLLACHYDMQGDVLYSIKWYKGRREFYRYTLKENPAKKVFKVVGMNVDVSVLCFYEEQYLNNFVALLSDPCSKPGRMPAMCC